YAAGLILLQTKSGIHPDLGIDAAFEPTRMYLRRVCEMYPEKQPQDEAAFAVFIVRILNFQMNRSAEYKRKPAQLAAANSQAGSLLVYSRTSCLAHWPQQPQSVPTPSFWRICA